MLSPTPSRGFVQLVVQKTHHRGNYVLQYPFLDASNTLRQCGDLYNHYIRMLFEFHYNYKIPTSGEYISNKRCTINLRIHL